MASNYTGNPGATQSPSATPGVGAVPTLVLPSDGDACNAASVAQAFKTTADYLGYLQKKNAVVHDHFTGSAISTAFWTTATTGTGTVTIADDSANGGMGTCKFDLANGIGSATLSTASLGIGTGDFTFVGRLRIASTIDNASLDWGLLSSSGFNPGLGFSIAPGPLPTTWGIFIDGGIHPPNGTPVLHNTSYAWFEINRFNNVVTFRINGVVTHTIATYTGSIIDGVVRVKSQSVIAAPTHIIWLDAMDLST